MVGKKSAKLLFVGVVLLLVFNLGCGNSKSASTGDSDVAKSGGKAPLTQKQIQAKKQAVVKAKKSSTKDLDQLNKGLDDLMKADADAEKLNPDEF